MKTLLVIHILFGTLALLSAAVAVSSAKGKKFHVLSGSTYFWSMTAIFLTAIPMSIFGLFVALPTLYAFYVGPYSYFRRSKEIQD